MISSIFNFGDRATNDANARLIAAAPDLLAALVRLVTDFEDSYDPDCCAVFADARAAIAKATEAP